MWVKRRNCFDSDEEYEKYLENVKKKILIESMK
jgi:hypothetical protein